MTNRLASQTSPYLLQHARNPVDWYPWGDEAFARARDEDKPVLLSVGYAACHWCHVMERESFEDAETAALMNENFVSVKVDREERPDVDSVYMAATQAMTGQGGWPMTVFMTPDGIPFLAGTYFPPEERHGMPSFRRVLTHVAELWTTRRGDLLAQGQRVIDAIRRGTPTPSTDPLQPNLLATAAGQIVAAHDRVNGGFGGPPKFPQAPVLEFGLRMQGRSPDVAAAVDRTLHAMALGGIYDQLGGGFSRYSVDATWTVPHFEKMLYDNVQLARVYTHAWQAGGDPLFKRIAVETLEYLLRDMRDAAGGFHSSEDADSEGEEGTFYVWRYDEINEIAPDAALYYGVTPQGNFEGARNVLTASTAQPPADAQAKLLEARSRRVRPGRDDKVLTSWNGLAIAALAEAGAAFGRDDFVQAATETARFVLEQMSRDSRLLHSYRAGTAQITGFCEDYAFMADGMLALWEATFDGRWLAEALRLYELAVELFGSPEGGFYTTASDAEALVVRQQEIIESATPAPGAVLALVGQRLGSLLERPDLTRRAVDALRVAHVYMERAAQAAATWLSALDFYVATPAEIAFTGPLHSDAGRALVGMVTGRFLPNKVLAARGENGTDPIVDQIPLLQDKPPTATITAYVCERSVCQAPTSDPDELASQLDSV